MSYNHDLNLHACSPGHCKQCIVTIAVRVTDFRYVDYLKRTFSGASLSTTHA